MKKNGYLILTAALSAVICVILMFDSEGTINAVKKSVYTCLNVIIPSLFAFMVFSQILVSGGAADKLFYPLYKISRFWFKGGSREFGIFMLSLIGGYPIGIKLLKEETALNINRKEIAEKMLGYCYCGSPTFIIQIAGLSVLGNGKAGLIIYFSNVLACFTLGVISNILSKKHLSRDLTPANNAALTLSNVTESISGTVKALGVICGTILAFNVLLELAAFSGLLNLLEKIGLNKIFCAVIEISNLSMFNGGGYNIMPLLAALTSFGGFCIILQTAALSEGKLKLKKFMLYRVPACLLSAVYCFLLTKMFPIAVETEASAEIIPVLSSINPICSVCLIIMTFILLKGVCKEPLNKTQSPRSKQCTHAADCVTLRFNQRLPKKENIYKNDSK